MRAALTAPVDLLWNGGIGTYVKSRTESHADVGDKANDTIRVDGADLRAKVVGEGGNLGLTQLGRIEYARAGGLINTDAIDNSAGVDTSDHEVNIKILLDQAVRDGALAADDRSPLLASMTDAVAHLVLRDNYEQNVLLGNARVQAPAMLSVHGRFISTLEARGELDRALEFLPAKAEIAQRESAGQGLTSSELAVLAAYSKITLTATVLDSDLPDDPWFAAAAAPLLPGPAGREARRPARGHPLRREIVTTWVSNDLVNRGGMTFVFRRPGGDRRQPRRGGPGLHAWSARCSGSATSGTPSRRWTTSSPPASSRCSTSRPRRLLDRSTRWLVQQRRASIDVAAEVEHFRAALDELVPQVPSSWSAPSGSGCCCGPRSSPASGCPTTSPSGPRHCSTRSPCSTWWRSRPRRRCRSPRWRASTSRSRSGSRSTGC